MSGCYAGVGSRETPAEILKLMGVLAQYLAGSGWVLRTGHASGADQAFERGALSLAEVYLPWETFEAHVPIYARYVLPEPTQLALEMAAKFHRSWSILSQGARKLHARNSHQVLGSDLRTPVEAVVCWTKNGSLTGHEPYSGGTGQALRIASAARIKVFNLQRPEHLIWAKKLVGWL